MNVFGKMPLLAEFGLVVLLAWMVSGWLLAGGGKMQPASTLQNIKVSTAGLPDLEELLTVSLFGKPPSKPAAKPVVQRVKPMVVNRLNIKLLGAVVAGDNSAAIISFASSGEQQVVFVGDAIQPGIKLFAVEAEAVVVEHGGALERVSLEQGEELSSLSLSTIIPGGAAGGSATIPRESRRQVDRAMLQKKISDFPSLMSEARVVPHFTDGKPDGFVITDIVIGSLYQQVGLQNGDIIRKVNGKQVSSAQQAMAMYRALENATSIDLELMRTGQMQQVHYDIR